MAQVIMIDISPSGNAKIDAQGFEDNTCAVATQQIEHVLNGGGRIKRDEKPEYYNPPVSSAQANKLTF